MERQFWRTDRLRRGISACGFAVALVASTSCNASYPTTPTDSVPVAFQVQYASAIMGFPTVGGVYSFAAYTLNGDGAYEDVTFKATWSSSNPLVLSPTSLVSFRAIAPGSAEVAARYQGLTSSISTFVILPGRQIYPYLAMSAAVPLIVGQKSQSVLRVQQSATVFQAVTELATWASSDTAVASVDRGLVTAILPGTVHITASYDGLSAWYGLSVRPAAR